MIKFNEKNYLPDTTAMAKKLLNFAEETFFCYEDFSLSKKYLPCSKVWHTVKDNKGRIIVLCSKVAEIENRAYEISLYAAINGKKRVIIGGYDEICDYIYSKTMKNHYEIDRYEKTVRNMWNQIKNEKISKKGIKRSGYIDPS